MRGGFSRVKSSGPVPFTSFATTVTVFPRHTLSVGSALRTFLLTSLALCAACVPAVTHGPRVQAGFSGGVTASLTGGPRYPSGDGGPEPFLRGPVGVNAGYGWRSDRGLWPAVRAGVHVPVPFAGALQPDLYLQLPSRLIGGLDAGGGVSWVAGEMGRISMPYAQLGHIGDDGTGWYTTQGFYRNVRNVSQPVRPVYRSDAWVPTIAYQWTTGRRTTSHLFLTGLFGRTLRRCDAYSNRICEREPRTGAIVGLTVEWHANARDRW